MLKQINFDKLLYLYGLFLAGVYTSIWIDSELLFFASIAGSWIVLMTYGFRLNQCIKDSDSKVDGAAEKLKVTVLKLFFILISFALVGNIAFVSYI